MPAGTANAALFEATEMAAPPAGAAAGRVTVQTVLIPAVSFVGAQERFSPFGRDGVNDNVTVFEVPPRLALSVADPVVVKLPAFAAKLFVVAPAATVTVAGTVTAGLLLARFTTEPPVGAAPVSVTKQLLVAPGVRVVGEQVRDDSTAAAVRVRDALFVLPL